MQERYEMAPGLWLPSYSQYDFEGAGCSSASRSTSGPSIQPKPPQLARQNRHCPQIRAEFRQLGEHPRRSLSCSLSIR